MCCPLSLGCELKNCGSYLDAVGAGICKGSSSITRQWGHNGQDMPSSGQQQPQEPTKQQQANIRDMFRSQMQVTPLDDRAVIPFLQVLDHMSGVFCSLRNS